MISPEQRAHLISMRLRQAEECISDVEFCLTNARFNLAVNRVYYGMFYAILALGVLRQFESSKHQQIIGWFNRTFIHTGIFPKHFTRLVKDAYDARTDSDYKLGDIMSAEDLVILLQDMKLFIDSVRTWIESNPD